MSGKVTVVVEMSFLDILDSMITSARRSILSIYQHVELEKIIVLMPDYLNRMWSRYLHERYNYMVKGTCGVIDKVQEHSGMKIFDNVENKIVIGCIDGPERGITPIVIEIP